MSIEIKSYSVTVIEDGALVERQIVEAGPYGK